MSNNSDAIVVSNLWKTFRLPHEKKNTFYEFLTGIFKNGYEEFVALKNINFVVKKGDAIGIIGDNGSGKSTLLKIITNILRPSKGVVKINGKITSFLELGVGFHPDLTVKENVYLYGAVMGLLDKEIDIKIKEILDFSRLNKFEDAKLKNLSSGMQVRLAFATAIQTNPEILLMDEVLAVGDLEFQQKCINIFQEYIKEKKTIVFVSHDLNSVRRFCNKALLLRHGEQIAFGDTGKIIDEYVYGMRGTENHHIENMKSINEDKHVIEKKKIRWGDKKVEITDVKFIDKFGNKNDMFNSGDSMIIYISYKINVTISSIVIGIAIYSDNDILCYGTNTDIQGFNINSNANDINEIELYIQNLTMMEGKFHLTVAVHSKDGVSYDWIDKQFSFDIVKKGNNAGLFDIPCKWV